MSATQKEQRRTHCPQGHDISEVGRAPNGQCRICRTEINRERTRQRRRTPDDKHRMQCQPVPNIGKVRRELGLSFQELSKYTEVSGSHLHYLENRQRTASARIQKKLLIGILRAQKDIAMRRGISSD